MNGLATRIALILVGKLVSPEVVTVGVNALFTFVEKKVAASGNATAAKILLEVETVVTRQEVIAAILALAQTLPKV